MSSNKPFPSSDLDVFKENSLILDNFVNSQENEHPDRFARKRPTITGIIKEAFNVRTDISNMNETLIGQSRWDAVPKNTSLSLGGDNGALNKQAQALFNRTEMLKVHAREALRRTYLEVGLVLVPGSFEEGGALQSVKDVLLEERTGKVYSWSGSFPKVVNKNTNPGDEVEFNIVTFSLYTLLQRQDGARYIGSGNYDYIDNYSGDAKIIRCHGVSNILDGGGGYFHLDLSDTTSRSSGICRIDKLGRRWKREIVGDYDWRWWGVKGDGVSDDYLAIKNMIEDVNIFSGPSGVFCISNTLPIKEGLEIRITDNPGKITAGLIKPHSSVQNPSTFDFFFADREEIEHVEISGLRFFGGRHVIRGYFPDGVLSGFISQVNFENCVFQELTGYVIESTNSVFVVDFHKCRLIKCGGVNIGYGVNILKFRQCGFENMDREYIKIDGAGSQLPSASIGLYGCRCEGMGNLSANNMCFDIKGHGRVFNFEITDGTYFENVFTNIGEISGVNGINISNINFTNDDNRVYKLILENCNGNIGNVESLVNTTFKLSGTSIIEQLGDISGGVLVETAGNGIFKSKMFVSKFLPIPGVMPVYKFTVTPTGNVGATVFSSIGGLIKVNFVSSRTNDGTPISSTKTFQVIVTKMYGGILKAISNEIGSVGDLGGGTLTLAFSNASNTDVTMSVVFAGNGSYSSGAALVVESDLTATATSENTIHVVKL